MDELINEIVEIVKLKTKRWTPHWKGVLLEKLSKVLNAAEQLRPADTLPECEIARSCYFGEDGKCLRGGECR